MQWVVVKMRVGEKRGVLVLVTMSVLVEEVESSKSVVAVDVSESVHESQSGQPKIK